MPLPYVKGYMIQGNEVIEVDKLNISEAVAEGNIITTPKDLAKYLSKLMQGKIINATMLSEMMNYIPTNESHQFYGLGCQYTPDIGYGHNGARPFYMTVMRYDPQSNITFVVFANFWDGTQWPDSFQSQLQFLYDILKKAKAILE